MRRPNTARPRIRAVVLAAAALTGLTGLVPLGAGAAGGAGEPSTPADYPDAGYRQRVLQVPAGAAQVQPRQVNSLGRVVGTFADPNGYVDRAAVWDARGVLTVLPDLGRGASAVGLDDRDRVVGSVVDAAGRSHAALWTNGRLRVVDPPGATESWGEFVNRSGQVAGKAADAGGGWTIFVWGSATGTRYVLPLGQRPSANPQVKGLDDGGAVVGTAFWPLSPGPVDGTETAFGWTPTGGFVDLLGPVRGQGPLYTLRDVHLSASGVVTVQATRQPFDDLQDVVWAVVPGREDPVPLADSPHDPGTAWDLAADVDDRGRVVTSVAQPGSGCGSVRYVGLEWDAVRGTRALSLGLCGELVSATNDSGELAGVWDPGERGGALWVWDAVRGLRSLGYGSVVDLTQAGHVLALGYHEPPGVLDPPEGLARVVSPVVLDTTLVRGGSRYLDKQPWLAVGGDALALLRIPVPAAPAGRRLVAATLQLHTTDAAGSGSATPMELRRALGGWSSTTSVSEWNTVLGTRRLGVIGAVGVDEPVSVRIDPADVPWTRGGSLELALTGTGTDTLRLWSQEAGPGLRPQVQLIYR